MKSRISVAGIAVRQGPRGPELFTARRLPGGALGEKWEFPGGKARSGETEKQALIREFNEEFSVPVKPLLFAGEAEFVHGETRFTLRAWGVRFLSMNFTLKFHSAWRWVLMEEAEALDFAGSDRLLFPSVKSALPGLLQSAGTEGKV